MNDFTTTPADPNLAAAAAAAVAYTVAAQPIPTPGPREYTYDKPSGWVTMLADGFRFNPWSGENCENLTLDRLAVYLQERPPTAHAVPAPAPAADPSVIVQVEPNETHVALMQEYAHLQGATDAGIKRMEEIKREMRGLVYGTHDLGGQTVTVSVNSRLDAARFETAYPIMQHPELYKSAPNPTAIRKALSPNDVALLSNVGEPRVVIK